MKNLLKYDEFLKENFEDSQEEIQPQEEPTQPDEPISPEPDDCFIECTGSKYNVSCGGQFQGEFVEMDDALDCYKEWQKGSPNYFPTLWFVSDHGNMWPIDENGDEIK